MMMPELELWRNSDHILVRDPATDQTRELAGVASVTFVDGSIFPALKLANEPDEKVIQTLAGPVRLRG